MQDRLEEHMQLLHSLPMVEQSSRRPVVLVVVVEVEVVVVLVDVVVVVTVEVTVVRDGVVEVGIVEVVDGVTIVEVLDEGVVVSFKFIFMCFILYNNSILGMG